ncbi:MAG: precorrin-6y C5,15-methyltransferase (decarboxylating) subunit CbiE [Pirellulales bacterium]|nr:precorrin-6y C5,15-methyltransferase (decarboxylating) subunit CbiE [Pirellulales bacterium]
MNPSSKIHIVGINQDGLAGLTGRARALVEAADLLVGDPYVLRLLPASDVPRLVVDSDLEKLAQRLTNATERRVVVLAAGDPLFYGVAHYLFDKLGKQRFEVSPHVSTMQLAFARVKESWEDALLTDFNFYDIRDVLDSIRRAEKVGIFTSEDLPPFKVAQVMLDAKLGYFTAYVCENLGAPNERVTHVELAELAEMVDWEFTPLSVMILIRKPGAPDQVNENLPRRLFGNPDEAFLQSTPKRGLLTPAEIRGLVLAELNLDSQSIVWDIGAGSGSVSVEAAQIATKGTVYPIEMDPEDHELIAANAERFHVTNLVPILGRAPDAWRALPEPDAIFIGGNGQGISSLVEAAVERLRPGGRLVATLGGVDNLAATHQVLHKLDPNVRLWMINLARGTYQLDRIRFESLNPTFVISAVKPR